MKRSLPQLPPVPSSGSPPLKRERGKKKKKSKKGKRKRQAPVPTEDRHRDIKPMAFRRPEGMYVPRDRFCLNEGREKRAFEALRSTSYRGLQVDDAAVIPSHVHAEFEAAFAALDQAQMFRHDVTQPLGIGTPSALTYVTRCLLGDPGITYKYLGVRMFSYPWHGSDVVAPGAVSGEGIVETFPMETAAAQKALLSLGKLNKWLSRRTQAVADSSSGGGTSDAPLAKPSAVGSASRFNMTLINRMDGINSAGHLVGTDGAATKRILKKEPMFEKDRCAVSWHADSSLQHFSSIAVYHHLVARRLTAAAAEAGHEVVAPGKGEPWRLGLRVHCDAEGPQRGKLKGSDGHAAAAIATVDETPPIAVNLTSGSAYYLCDAFNHHHQHCVLAGSALRYASTHRVSRTDGHSFASIVELCHSVLNRASGANGRGEKQWRSEQQLLDTLEFEWIRQFYVQGSAHYALHTWWHEPLRELLSFWTQLEQRTAAAVDAVAAAAETLEVHCSRRAASSAERAAALAAPLPITDAAWGAMDRPARKRVKKRRAAARFVLSAEMGAPAVETLISALAKRRQTRELWRERESDPAYAKLAAGDAPMRLPLFTPDAAPSPLFDDLTVTIDAVEEHRETLAIVWGEGR